MTEIWRGTWVVGYREILRFISERARILSAFALPLLLLLVFGAGFTQTVGALAPGVNYVQFMYPGLIAMTVLLSSLLAGTSIVVDRELGFLREILVAPVARIGIVLGKAMGSALVALIQAVVLLVLAPLLGVRLSVGAFLLLIPVVLLLSLGLSALGILLASFMRSQQGFQLILQVLIVPLIFLAGVFFPVDNVPVWMEAITKVNPLTYGVDATRQVLLQEGHRLGVTVFGHTMSLANDLVLMAFLAVLLLAGAALAFNRQE